jgi:hypothetical protein
VSVRGYWNPAPPNNSLGALLNSASPTLRIGSSFVSDADEELGTVTQGFYQLVTPGTTAGTWSFSAAFPSLGSLSLGTATNDFDSNLLSFRTDYSYWGTSTDVPDYLITAPKLERGAWGASPYTPVDITVQATIFAQEGSWFVIPAPLAAMVAPADTNGNGTIDASEQGEATVLSTRFRRPNYRIQVIGNIAQNMTPTETIDYDFTSGAMRDWADATAYPTSFTTMLGGGSAGSNWVSVLYTAERIDPATSQRLYLPVSPDLIYTG